MKNRSQQRFVQVAPEAAGIPLGGPHPSLAGGGEHRDRRRRRARHRSPRPGPLDQAWRVTTDFLDRVTGRAVAAGKRARRGAVGTLAEAAEEYFAANPLRKPSTETSYRSQMRHCFADWLPRRLDTITRRDVEARFHLLTERRGRSTANHAISLLRAVYRRPCVDHAALRNPVELWIAGGGRYHRVQRRRIPSPADVLPHWRAGIEAAVAVPATRDIFWFGMYTGMRRGEILALRWEDVDLGRRVLRVEETKNGQALELPITRQLAGVLERRRREASNDPSRNPEGWVFPSSGVSGHIVELHHLYARIGSAGGAKFWFHGLRNAFITVAERELMLPRSLTKRLVNHTRTSDVTEDYAAEWSIGQLREPAQRIADRIDELASAAPEPPSPGTG